MIEGCGVLRLGWGWEVSLCVFGIESRGVGMVFCKSIRCLVRSWGKFWVKVLKCFSN